MYVVTLKNLRETESIIVYESSTRAFESVGQWLELSPNHSAKLKRVPTVEQLADEILSGVYKDSWIKIVVDRLCEKLG
jgi:hypothetical protein